MRGDYVFVVCVCVVCLFVYLDVFDIETTVLVWWYILTISRSTLSIKVIGSKSRSSHIKMLILLPGHQFDLV